MSARAWPEGHRTYLGRGGALVLEWADGELTTWLHLVGGHPANGNGETRAVTLDRDQTLALCRTLEDIRASMPEASQR